MPRRQVFICYSSKDRRLFNEFRTHLAPFEQQDLLLSWSDQEIRASEPWDRRIHQAIDDADAAVMLVSPEMLASKYVVEEEIPRLMEAAEAGRLRLMSLFLHSCNPDVQSFDVLDATTGERGIRITKYQGLNQPSSPVAGRPKAARNRLLSECADELGKALEELPVARERRRTTLLRELSVELRVADGRVHRRYGKPGIEDLHRSEGPIDLSRFTALTEGIVSPELDEELGPRLFEILLGTESNWRVALRRALGEEAGSPVRHGMRLRIITDDPLLRDLPWAISRWHGYSLAEMGWSFEHAARLEAPPQLALDTPCSALMVTAEPDDGNRFNVEAHEASFRALLDRVWNHPVSTRLYQVATTPDDMVRYLAEEPRLVYVYCQARGKSGGPELVLRDADGKPRPLPFACLTDAWKLPPQILFLNTVGPCPPAPPVPGVPLVVHLRRRDADWATRRDAQIWWNEVLGGRWDPVRAFHELGREARRCGIIRTDYQNWKTTVSELTPKVDLPRARFDRKDHREAVMGAVRRLVDGRERRVTCVVAYGPPGNLVDHFMFQVTDTLKDWALGLARIEGHHLKFPDRRDSLDAARLVEHFRDLMELQLGQELRAAFSAPRRGGPTATPVHFLNWGCYGPDHLPALRSTHLETWLSFCRDHLAPACPERSRILSYVAVVTPPERHEDLQKLIEKRQAELRKPRFEILLLPALGEITANDLAVFLEDAENTSCPREYLRDLPERIYQRTRGNFEATVELLEEAERGNMWAELHRTLPEAPPPGRPRKDFEL